MYIQRIRWHLVLAVFAAAAVVLPLPTLQASPDWDEGETAELYIRSHDPAVFSGDAWEAHDNDADGNIDYVVLVDGAGLKVQEAYDYSGDGQLDDFYFYDNGELVIREVDSDNDGQIDIWVRLVSGYLISEVQRDTTGDGSADFVRTYDGE